MLLFFFPEHTSASKFNRVHFKIMHPFNVQKDTLFYTESIRWSFKSIAFTKDTKYFLDSLVSHSLKKQYKSLNIALMECIDKEASSVLIYRRAKYIEDYIKLNYQELPNLSITVSTKLVDDERDINFNINGLSKEHILDRLNKNLPIILISLNSTN